MTKPNPPIDWETTMKTTEANASVAAKMTERAVAALSETLEHLRHHGHQLSRLETMMKEAKAQPVPQPHCPSLPLPPAPRTLHPLPLIVAFTAGALFAVFTGSW